METISDEMLVVGGGSRSLFWQQIYADVYNTTIVRTNIDQQAAALGAAACAAVGCGLWDSLDYVDEIHQVLDVIHPDPANTAAYEKLLPVFRRAGKMLSSLGDEIHQINA